MRKAPSIQNLIQAFDISIDDAKFIRAALQNKKINLISGKNEYGFFGIEYVTDVYGKVMFTYINTGDTYSPTIVRRSCSNTYRISTWGDEVEALEKTGVKF